jgi:hypothetical protein
LQNLHSLSRGNTPLTREQTELFHAPAPDWQLTEEAHRIERSFRFRNFRQALTFVQEIDELAEAEGPSSEYQLRLGQCDGLPADQEDQGTAWELPGSSFGEIDVYRGSVGDSEASAHMASSLSRTRSWYNSWRAWGIPKRLQFPFDSLVVSVFPAAG